MAYHKKGFFNSTVGNWFRGFMGGGLLTGALTAGAMAVASIFFPPLAAFILPVAIGAGLVGGQTIGFLNGTGGALRWTKELITGGKAPNEQEQARGGDGGVLGLVVAIAAAVFAGKGMQSIREGMQGIRDWTNGGQEPSGSQERNGQQNGRDQQSRQPRQTRPAPPPMPVLTPEQARQQEEAQLLQRHTPRGLRTDIPKGLRVDHNGRLVVTASELANPKIREKIEQYGEQMLDNRQKWMEQAAKLEAKGDIRARDAVYNHVAANDQRAHRAIGAGHNGMFVFDPTQLAVRSNRQALFAAGEAALLQGQQRAQQLQGLNFDTPQQVPPVAPVAPGVGVGMQQPVPPVGVQPGFAPLPQPGMQTALNQARHVVQPLGQPNPVVNGAGTQAPQAPAQPLGSPAALEAVVQRNVAQGAVLLTPPSGASERLPGGAVDLRNLRDAASGLNGAVPLGPSAGPVRPGAAAAPATGPQATGRA